MENLFIKNKIKIVILIFLILFLILTRFYKLRDTAFFVNDQGRDIKVLHSMFVDKKMTLIGPATSFAGNYGNIYFGPYYYYFLLPFYLINQSPYFMTAVFPLLFIFGIFLFFLVGEFEFGQKLIIVLLLTFSWYCMYYTRFLWNLNLAFLVSFILFSIFLIFKRKIVKHNTLSLVFGLMSGMAFQIHYGMLFLYISLLAFFLKNKKNLFLYFIGLTISFFPFLIFDIRHQYVISKNIQSLLISLFEFQNKGLSMSSLVSIFAKIFDYYLFPLISLDYWLKATIALFVYCYVIFFHLRKKKEINLLIVFSFIIFILSFFVFKRDFDYYLACFMIWFYLGLGLALFDLVKTIRGKLFVTVFLILFICLNSYKYFKLPINSFGLKTQYKIINAIKKDLVNKKTNALVIYVFPHKDDVNSLEYLMILQNYQITSASKNKYFVCYSGCVNLNEANIKLFSGDVSVYTNY